MTDTTARRAIITRAVEALHEDQTRVPGGVGQGAVRQPAG